MTSATIMGHVRTELTVNHGVSTALASGHYDLFNTILGFTGGSIGETSTALILLGGLYIIYKRIISWHIPVTMIITIFLLASLFHTIDSERFASPMFHVFSGGFMLGAFFIATDLVTSPNTKLGQIVFAVGISLLVFVIRTWGGYPEGMGFAVLLMNALTPLIDHYIKPRIYGRDRKGNPLTAPERE